VIVSRLVMLAGLGALAAALFRCDAGCPGLFDGSGANTVHGIASLVFFTAIFVSMALSWRALRIVERERPLGWLTFLGLVVAFFAGAYAISIGSNDAQFGLVQRIFLLAETGWLGLIGLRLV
jgi:hypothetical protein